MKTASAANRFRDSVKKVFERIVLRCGSLSEMAQRSGWSGNWIWRQLRGNKSFDIGKAAEIQLSLELPLRYFLEEAADAAPAFDPGWVLRHVRGEGSRQDPFLAAVEERLRPLAGLLVVAAPVARRQREIETLGEKAALDPQAAKAELEILAGELLDRAEAGVAAGRGISRAVLADGARLLLAWGAVQRSNGNQEDALDAGVLAGRLAQAAGDSAALAPFTSTALACCSISKRPARPCASRGPRATFSSASAAAGCFPKPSSRSAWRRPPWSGLASRAFTPSPPCAAPREWTGTCAPRPGCSWRISPAAAAITRAGWRCSAAPGNTRGARTHTRSLAQVGAIRRALEEVHPGSGIDKSFAFDRQCAAQRRLSRREAR